MYNNHNFRDYNTIFYKMLDDMCNCGLLQNEQMEEIIQYVKNREDLGNFLVMDNSIVAESESDIYKLLEEIYESHMISKSKSVDLDNLGELVGVPRIPATKSEVSVTIVLPAPVDDDFIYTKSLLFSTMKEGVVYRSISNLYIPKGEDTGNVYCVCEITGSKGYINREMIKGFLGTAPFEVKQIINHYPSTKGNDKETDESYRKRIKELAERKSKR